MSSVELELYELLKIKPGEKETKLDIEKLKVELVVIKWMLRSVLVGILSLIVKSFFKFFFLN